MTYRIVDIQAVLDDTTGKFAGFKQVGIPGQAQALTLAELQSAFASSSDSTFAALGVGDFDGQVKRVTNVGNVKFYMEWNAADAKWRPMHGRQLMYTATPTISESGTNRTITLPQFDAPAGLFGTTLGFEADLIFQLSVDPTASAVTMALGATTFVLWTGATNRKQGRLCGFRNMNAANVQRAIIKRDVNEYTPFGSAAGNLTTMAEDTSQAIAITGSVSYTNATPGIAELVRANYYLTRG